MTINRARMAAIIKNIGELVNSGITASISYKMDEGTSPLRKAAPTRELRKYAKWTEKIKKNLCDELTTPGGEFGVLCYLLRYSR